MANTQNEIRKEFEALTDEELKQVTGGNIVDSLLDECLQYVDRATDIINDALPSATGIDADRLDNMLYYLGYIKTDISVKNYNSAKYNSQGIYDFLIGMINVPAYLVDTLDGISYCLSNVQ